MSSQSPTQKSESPLQPRVVEKSNSSKLTIDIAGAAIFGALSIVVSIYTTANLPRMEWGIAFFDPVSIIWIIAFLIFGFRSGILTCIIGTIGLIPFDPSGPIGPIMKFIATIWLVVIPWAYAKILVQRTPTSDDMGQARVYIPGMTLGWIIRVIIMIMLNYIIIQYVWQINVDFLSLRWLGHEEINGWIAVIITVFLLNTLQTIFDSVISYAIVFKFGVHNRFKLY